MGLLTTGQPLCWQETKKYSNHVRKRGIEQFVRLYRTFLKRNTDTFKYGDEVEYNLIKFDHTKKRVYLLLKAHELIPALANLDNENLSIDKTKRLTCWTPEFANFMIEGLPGHPYEHEVSSIAKIEPNMNLRRRQVQELLSSSENEFIITCTTFPLLGCLNFTWPNLMPTPDRGITTSMFFPDEAIYQGHPRYAASIINNRERRQSKTYTNIPIFRDLNTPSPFKDDLSEFNTSFSSSERKLDHVYLEGIGGACSCLQVTFQARNIDEARVLYDQLTPMTPIILALSAASPIWRGYLTDIDCRWMVISDSLDDRTQEEKGEVPLKNGKQRIYKSRYDSVDCYLTQKGANYNDIEVVVNKEFYESLTKRGVDHLMAQHISHLFIRDPIVLYKENLRLSEHGDENFQEKLNSSWNDETVLDENQQKDTDHFENIQSSNWQSMRFKPPPICDPNSSVGWRVEFRTTELQTSDFENASFVSFLVLLSRVILSYNLNMLIPISKIDENMKRAQKRDACMSQRFYFRKNLFDDESAIVDEMSIDEIINGSDKFQGIIPLINEYLSHLDNIDVNTHCKITNYLKLISYKASGRLKTTAAWMRSFVSNHHKYDFDSKVDNEIAYDLMWELCQISNGHRVCDDLNKV